MTPIREKGPTRSSFKICSTKRCPRASIWRFLPTDHLEQYITSIYVISIGLQTVINRFDNKFGN